MQNPTVTSPVRASPRYRLVVFDMDGTLTEERIDFQAVRQDIGVPEDLGVLEYIGRLDPAARASAQAILHRHEMAAAQSCSLQEGAHQVLAALQALGVGTALLTRNSGICTRAVLRRHELMLDFVATREDLPHKPHADSLLRIMRRFAVSPKQTLMVGDYLYDLQTAQAAGTDSVLLSRKPDWPAFAKMATYCMRHLCDVLRLVNGTTQGEAL